MVFESPRDHLKREILETIKELTSFSDLRFTCCGHKSEDFITKAKQCYKMGQGWLTLARAKKA